MNIDKHRQILHEWGEITSRARRIEQLQLEIGKLKDEILNHQRNITDIQDDEEGTANAPGAANVRDELTTGTTGRTHP